MHLRKLSGNIDQEKQLLVLNEQIIVLEKIINEKKMSEESIDDIRVLEKSLQICSDKKKVVESSRKSVSFNSARLNVSRKLLRDFESSFADDREVNSDSANCEAG